MAQIRPFRAYRPCQGMEKRIAALPYDVYNREEACEVVKKNRTLFWRLIGRRRSLARK